MLGLPLLLCLSTSLLGCFTTNLTLFLVDDDFRAQLGPPVDGSKQYILVFHVGDHHQHPKSQHQFALRLFGGLDSLGSSVAIHSLCFFPAA